MEQIDSSGHFSKGSITEDGSEYDFAQPRTVEDRYNGVTLAYCVYCSGWHTTWLPFGFQMCMPPISSLNNVGYVDVSQFVDHNQK